jgi:hypothetical protein
MPSSYDDLPQTRAELRSTFALVRLQIVSPLSLLVSIGSSRCLPSPLRFFSPPFPSELISFIPQLSLDVVLVNAGANVVCAALITPSMGSSPLPSFLTFLLPLLDPL